MHPRKTDLWDEFDEVLDKRTPRDEFVQRFSSIKLKHGGTLMAYMSPEFKELRRRLIMVLGYPKAEELIQENP